MPLGEHTANFFSMLKKDLSKKDVLSKTSIHEYRRSSLLFYKSIAEDTIDENIIIQDKFIIGPDKNILKLRIYFSNDLEFPAAGVVFFPGGGFTLDLENIYDVPCSNMAKVSGAIIIKVSCRLAPEFDHSIGFKDAYFSTKYIYNNAGKFKIDPNRFAVAGNSSGGNFAALVANKAKNDPNLRIARQFLLSPRVDVTLSSGNNNDFLKYEIEDIMLSKEAVEYNRKFYLPKNVDPTDPSISPYYDHLVGVPPVTILAGEYDGARGDTEIYTAKLAASGVEVKKIICEGQTHSTFIARKVLKDGVDPAIIIGEEIKKDLVKKVCNTTNDYVYCSAKL